MAKVEAKAKHVMEKKDFPFDWEVIENEWITMSDGCRLSSRIWLPKTDKPVPVIFETQPYRKRDGMRGRDEPMYGFFAGQKKRGANQWCDYEQS